MAKIRAVNVIAEREDDYLRHHIEATLFAPGDLCVVRVQPPAAAPAVSFSERFDAVMRYDSRFEGPKDEPAFIAWALARGVGRARGALATDKLQNLHAVEFVYTDAPKDSSSISETDMEVLILRALRRLKRLDPARQGHIPLDAKGICLIEGISYDDLTYSEKRLTDRGLVAAFAMGWDEHNHFETITESGLLALDEVERSPAPATAGLQADARYDSFVSFSFTDSGHARDLAALIEGSGMVPFLAVHAIQGGDDFAESIREGLSTSAEVVLLVSRASLGSEWVTTEWGAAWVLGRRITPILLDVSVEELPDRLRRLQCIQWDDRNVYVEQLTARRRP